jgi:hypothetical protein
MSKSVHGALNGLEPFDLLSLDAFLLVDENARGAAGLDLAQAAVEAALLEHSRDGVPATPAGGGGDALLNGGEPGQTHSAPGLSLAQSALEDTPAYDFVGPGPLFALDFTTMGSSFLAPAGARPTLTANAGDITVLEPQLSGAKGGIPGPPSDGGGDDGGADGGVLTKYHSGSLDGDAGYDIEIEFKGSGWTVDLQQAFIASADYLTTVITHDIGGGAKYRGKTIDDLYISAEVKAIDGPGGVLGQAGPTAIWSETQLPAAGIMEFDVADVSTFYDLGLWDDIVTHEMIHVLGFGSLWNYGRHAVLVDGEQYTGANALEAYNRVFGSDAAFIPVETDGGSGTAGAHWDEAELKNELMTGYINNDNDATTHDDNYLSEFSVMALADLGYVVDYYDYPYDNPTIEGDALIA